MTRRNIPLLLCLALAAGLAVLGIAQAATEAPAGFGTPVNNDPTAAQVTSKARDAHYVPLVTRIQLHHIPLQRRLALQPAVEHMPTRVLPHLDALRLPHDRHLIDDQYRRHERT